VSAPVELCDYLRAKVGAAHDDKRALFALRDEATTVYWCLLTMSPAGPDDGLAHARRCGAGRVCCVNAEAEAGPSES
jgi:hypothetical protein